MNRLAVVSLALALPASLAACSGARPETSHTSTASADSTGQCAPYPTNPACSSDFFVAKAWAMAQEDPRVNALEPVGEAVACLADLSAAGAIIAGTAAAPPLVISAGAVLGLLMRIDGCVSVAAYLNSTGLPDNLSCFLEPVVNDKGVQLCECNASCQSGASNSGQMGDYSPPRVFQYGYLDRIGSARCYCTDDSKEASCQLNCDKGWSSSDPNDCTCQW